MSSSEIRTSRFKLSSIEANRYQYLSTSKAAEALLASHLHSLFVEFIGGCIVSV